MQSVDRLDQLLHKYLNAQVLVSRFTLISLASHPVLASDSTPTVCAAHSPFADRLMRIITHKTGKHFLDLASSNLSYSC